MKSLKLPALPSAVEPAAFVAECEAALSVLIPMETAVSRDLENEEYYRRERGVYPHPKAVAHLKTELGRIQALKKSIGLAKCDATIAAATPRAEEFDRAADALRPAVDAARADFDAAKKRLGEAEAALAWQENRARGARQRADDARREREAFDPKPVAAHAFATMGGMATTVEQELATIGRR